MLVSAGFPILARAARDDEARLGYALQKMFEVANVLGAFIAMGLAIAAPFAIEVVAGKGFHASVSVLRLQSCGLLTSFLMVTWTYALVSLRLYRPLLMANALAAFVAIVATLRAGAAAGRGGRGDRDGGSPRRRWPAARCGGCAAPARPDADYRGGAEGRAGRGRGRRGRAALPVSPLVQSIAAGRVRGARVRPEVPCRTR